MTARLQRGGNRRTWRVVLGLGLLVHLVGCGETPPPAAPSATRFDGVRLVVGVVGDHPALLQSIGAQRGEWVARTGSELTLRAGSLDPDAVPAEVDLLVFPAERLGDLVDAGALAVLPESVVASPAASTEAADPADPGARSAEPADPLKFAEIVAGFRDQVSRYGPDRYGLPIGGSALVVAFLRSAFTDPTLIEAAGSAGLTLQPPRTWDEFDALARFFHGRDLDGDGQADFGVALAWGADSEGVGDAVYLARTASAALHPNQYSFLLDSETTEPRVTSPPFVESLQALVQLRDLGPPGGEKFDAPAARAAFRAGRVALLVDRAELAATWGTGKTPIGVASLPGSTRIFDPSRGVWETPNAPNQPSYLPFGGGWLVGLAAKTSHQTAAEACARYLASPETTDRFRAERDFPMLAVRDPQLTRGMANPRSAPGVETRPWADAVATTLRADQSVLVPGLRIPGATGYLADLATARVAAVNGQAVPEALTHLAAAWTKRTQALGTARQTWHHRRSLNGPSTAPKPPAR